MMWCKSGKFLHFYLHSCVSCIQKVCRPPNNLIQYQVLCKSLSTAAQQRSYSDSTSKWKGYELKSRGLVQLNGPDSITFLQGLVTNDVSFLIQAQYNMLLNVQGRVLYDLMLYNISHKRGENTFLIECDSTVRGELLSLIKKFKIRKKIELRDASEELSVVAALPPGDDSLPYVSTNLSSVVMETQDPRVPLFGMRLITSAVSDLDAALEMQSHETDYHRRRYIWGIPEGTTDLPPGNCFPLESNLNFMNGVNFNKGCYLGQELTARTHHTGVTRKRLMPLIFDSEPDDIDVGENIKNEKGKSVGKFRSAVGIHGLGLMRTAEVKGQLNVANKGGKTFTLSAVVPHWWPSTSN